MKKQLLFILSAAILALVSCNRIDPEKKEPVRASIPIRLGTQVTKVSYDGTDASHPYSVKSGDKLSVRGVSRTDISALLDYDSASGEWSGDLWYDAEQPAPGNGTALAATLIHAGNTDESTYAHGCAANFQTAVETLSLFTGSLELGDEQVMLHQQTSFVNTTITFNFTGTGSMATGETSVEVIIGNETIASGSAVIGNGAVPGTYTSSFTLALPGGTTLTDGGAIMRVCDRDIPMRNSGAAAATLVANKSYSINRSCDFKPELGDPYWSDGTYGRIAHEAGIAITGIIVYVNNDDSAESLAITESAHGGGHALVMALHNASSGDKWTSITAPALTPLVTTPAEAVAISNVSGFSNTQAQAGKRAPDYALNYRSGEGDDHTNDTGWFLPSVGQWIYSLSDFASVDPMENWFNREGKNWITLGKFNDLVFVKEGPADANLLIESLNNRFEVLQNHLGCTYDTFGILVWDGTVNKYVFSDSYWTSTEYNDSQAVRFNLGSVEQKNSKYYSTLKVAALSKSSTFAWKAECPMKVRPFLAF